MTPTFLDSVLRGAEALAARDVVGTLPDPDLLRRFAAERDPAAFAVLVRRHGPLVWGVCRNLLNADADAEDAFQATFLTLVKSAGTVRRAEALGGWLHGVAYRIAIKARRAAVRRRQRENAAAVSELDSPVPDAAWDELQSAVHAEVCRLPEKLRLPFILCGLQGRQQKDAAKQLGCKVGTLSARLTQARQRLLDRLARRGVPVGVAVSAAVLGVASCTAAVPALLCLRTFEAARDPAAASEIVLSLARGASFMSVTRTKMLAVAVLAAALTTGVGTRLLSTADAQPPARESEADRVKKALEYLSKQQARTEWEYKFIPMEKPLRIADLQAVLRTAELEGWEYCGSQDLASADAKPRTFPHLAFKRRRDDAAAAQSTAAAALAALADAEANRDAAAKAARRAEAAIRNAAERDDAARLVAHEAEVAREIYASQLKAAREALTLERERSARLEQLIQKERPARDSFLKRMSDLEAGKAADPRAATTTLTLPLKHVPAREAAEVLGLAQTRDVLPSAGLQASADERSNSLILRGPSDLLARIKEAVTTTLDVPSANQSRSGDADQTIRVPLRYVDAKVAADRLGEILPGARIVAEVQSNSIVLKGPPHIIDAARKHIETTIDLKPGTAMSTKGANIELAVIPLKRANPKVVLDEVSKVLAGSYKAEVVGNAIVVAGSADVVLNVRKVVETLDRPSK